MDEFDYLFSADLIKMMEESALIRLITATTTEEEAKQLKLFVRAFTKRGVPARTVLDAMIEIGGADMRGVKDCK